MRHPIGLQDARWREGQIEPVTIDTDRLINGHMLVAGMTGTGKSYQIQQLLKSCARHGVVVDVFDVHEELDGAPASYAVKYSAATRVGYNPLVVNPDPHSGGPLNQIAFVVDMLNRSSTSKLGARQERALYNLIGDVYHLRGIYPDNPRSWIKRELTEREWIALKEARNYQGMRDCYPTLGDLIDHAERKLKQLMLGTTSQCVAALERVMSTATRLQSLQSKYQKASPDEAARLSEQFVKEKAKAIECYTEFVESIELGREFQDASKFSNTETLHSLLDRIKSLAVPGIFSSNSPDWGDARIRVHQIGSLNDEHRRLLVYNRCAQILRECMDAGKSDSVRRAILLDEGHLYYSEDGDNPINRISKEGRKFGLALIIGSQSPTHFSDDFLTSCGTIMLLGIHEKFWDMAVRQLRIDKDALMRTRPREVLSLKMQFAGEMSSRFISVNVNRAAVEQGMLQLRQQMEEQRRAAAR